MTNKVFISLLLFLLVAGGVKFYLKYTSGIEEGNQATSEYAFDKVLIYSREGCSYCTKAKILLEQKNIKFELVELAGNQDLYNKLVSQTGQRTVPYIFVNDKFIGGYQDLKKLADSSKF